MTILISNEKIADHFSCFGSVIFLGSSRLFSLCGPDSETELKRALAMAPKPKDGEEGEEVDEEKSGPYYARDPLRWLDDYLEREGLPFDFNFVKAESAKDWTCSIE